MALKYEGLFEKGDMIKAFDHQPIPHPDYPDRFIVGVVQSGGMVHTKTNPPYMAYSILVVYDSNFTDPDHTRVGELIHVPMGMSMSDYDGRITLVKKGPFRLYCNHTLYSNEH